MNTRSIKSYLHLFSLHFYMVCIRDQKQNHHEHLQKLVFPQHHFIRLSNNAHSAELRSILPSRHESQTQWSQLSQVVTICAHVHLREKQGWLPHRHNESSEVQRPGILGLKGWKQHGDVLTHKFNEPQNQGNMSPLLHCGKNLGSC